IFIKDVIKSNYKDLSILNKYLQLIYQNFGDINEINRILSYSIKLNNHGFSDFQKYGICYMILKNYKESQILFEHSIQLNNKDLGTYFYYGSMLLQSSQFDKLNNIIQIIKNIDSKFDYGLAYRLESEILIENGEYKSAENILGYYFYYI